MTLEEFNIRYSFSWVSQPLGSEFDSRGGQNIHKLINFLLKINDGREKA